MAVKIKPWTIPFLFALIILSAIKIEAQPVRGFNLSDVKILDGPFLIAQQADLNYILALDPDRLLAPYLKDAGITPLKDNYSNWESSGLNGHTGGHYLSALSLMYAATGMEELSTRLNYMIKWLDSCQQKNGNGYVGGIPDGQAFWKEIAAGNTKAVQSRWVPLYNIHKLYAGLYDAYRLAGNEKAFGILVNLSDWFYNLAQKLTDDQIQEILKTEHGGLNEVFAQVAKITGNKKYLELAIRMSERSILNPLIRQKNELAGKHANTQIPKIIGFKYIADATGKPDWDSASVFFWNTVINRWTVSIGGNSIREHFHSPDDFSAMVSHNQGPETCNTYNMLKLTQLLYFSDPQTKYMDYYEKALFNHILSSVHPVKSGFVYFTPMRPRHYRVYSQAQESFWCCVGTGMENHAKYGEMIYAHDDNNLFVNLFIASALNWKEKELNLTQYTKFPYENFSVLKIQTHEPIKMSLKIRKPVWAIEREIKVYVNNKITSNYTVQDNFITLARTWTNGDEVKIEMPMHVNLEYLPDGSSWASVKYGPIVLAAISDSTHLDGLFANDDRWGHVANGSLYPVHEGPSLISEKRDFAASVKPLDLKKLTFQVPGLVYPEKYKNMVLRPFSEIHEARYSIYFPVLTRKEFEVRQKLLAEKEKAIIELEKRTIDQIAPGEQQPETDHNFKGKDTRSGMNLNKHWRDASGWFSYDLFDPKKEAKSLQLTYYGLDRKRVFDIYLNGIKLASVNLDTEKGDDLYTVDYKIPEEIRKINNGVLNIKFIAAPASRAGGIYYIRLLK